MKRVFSIIAMIALMTTTLTSCNSDDDNSMSQKSILTVENVAVLKDFVQSDAFYGMGNEEINLPVILPGQSISFKFNAGKGQHLMFATMYGHSKDWFFAPENPGIQLYDDSGNAITGDVSSKIKLWDNGTKNNDTGEDENNIIEMVSDIDASMLMKVEMTYEQRTSEFTLTLTNTSGGTMHETPFSPGVWAVSNVLGGELLNNTPFYRAGDVSNPEMTALSQTGNNEPLKMKINSNTGIITGLSPVLAVVYKSDKNPIFQVGEKDRGMGLKALAQKGDASELVVSLKSIAGVKAIYVLGDSPIAPGAKISTEIQMSPSDKIVFATMFGYSNDWFYANAEGLNYNVKGDLTSKIMLYDSGTGIDQFPGAGNNQALFGGMPEMESMNITEVNSAYPIPAVSNILKLSLN